MRITILKVSPHVEVLKADPFSYQAIHEGKICKFRYVGSEYLLYNKTSDCSRPLTRSEISDNLVISEGCKKNEAGIGHQRFEPQSCHKLAYSNLTVPQVQLKFDGRGLLVNCQGHVIVINTDKIDCPNYIFSLNEDSIFVIDGLSYRHERVNIRKMAFDLDISTRLNLQLGLSKTEFHSLTSEEIRTLQSTGENAKRKKIADNLMENGYDDGQTMGELVHDTVVKIGGYLAIGIALLVVFVYIKSRLNQPLVVHAVGICCLILAPTGMLCDSLIQYSSTAEEATREISDLQSRMISSRCNIWDLNEDLTSWKRDEGFYVVSLACSLAHMKIKCPCAPLGETTPVVRYDELRMITNVTTEECEGDLEPKRFSSELNLFHTAEEYLCSESRKDRWPQDVYGQLVASACSLSRMAYNCHCAAKHTHKTVTRDLLTRKFKWNLLPPTSKNALANVPINAPNGNTRN